MAIMSALSQPTRLAVFRRLVAAQPGGLASGEIAEAIGTSPNTMSAHLAILSRAGLVDAEKTGRTVTYRARTAPVGDLGEFVARLADGE